MKNATYGSNDVKRVCEKKLNINFRDGKEYNGWFVLKDGKKAKRITVPKGRKFLPGGTYKSMATQLGLTIPDFDSLLDCPLTKEEYLKKLAAQIQNNQR